MFVLILSKFIKMLFILFNADLLIDDMNLG